MRDVTIYALKDPVTQHVRYVGKSVDVYKRFKNHLCNKSKSHTASWIKNLASKGLIPLFEIVEVIPNGTDWHEREKFWICFARQAGCDLTNLTEGGEGMHGLRVSEQTREKMRCSARKLSAQKRARQTKVTIEMVEQMLFLSRQGLSQRKIATRFNITHGTVHNWIRGRKQAHFSMLPMEKRP